MIEYYESSEDAPFQNWHKFNHFLALKTGTGDEPIDLVNHVDRAIGYINSKDDASSIKELSNLKLAYHYMIKEVSLSAYANACMIKSIDGKVCNGITQKELDYKVELLKELKLSNGSIKDKASLIKKKLIHKLKSIILKAKI